MTVLSEEICGMISVLLNFLRLILQPEHLVCHRKCCCLCACVFCSFGQDVLHVSVWSIWSIALFKITVSLLALSLDDLFIMQSKLLSPQQLLYYCLFLLLALSVFDFYIQVIQCWTHKCLQLVYFLDILTLLSLNNDFLCLFVNHRMIITWIVSSLYI